MSEAAAVPVMHTFHRYWPDGSYCPEGREHVTWVTIQTTAESVDAFGTDGPIVWCGCGTSGWIAAEDAPEPARDQTVGGA